MTKKQTLIIEEGIILLNIKDVIKITGWCEATVREIFMYDNDFPAIKKGKKYQVEYSALKNYLLKRRTNK